MREGLWFVGAYTADMGGNAEGIAALSSRADGSLHYRGLAVAAQSPSYLAARGDTIYSVAEGGRRVEAFRRGDGFSLIPGETAPAGGDAPCHLGIFGDLIVVSCYGDGRLGVLSIGGIHGGDAHDGDAAPLALVQRIAGAGSGPHPDQSGPRAHATFAADGATVLSADLGADEIHVHRSEHGLLTRIGSLALPAGAGPRDFVRHPSGCIYVLGELSHHVFVLEFLDGALNLIGQVALPGAAPGDHAAVVSVSADGRFAYAGLRGSDQISVLAVDDGGRSLRAVGAVSSAGAWPRHHVVDGDLMHVANERSNSVASFRIGSDGIPLLIAPPTPVSSPTFLLRAAR